MLVDADGSPHGHTVYTYTAGEVYSSQSTPSVTEPLMAAFVASGRAVEVDEQGNPVVAPASRRARKSAATEEPEADTASESSEPAETVAESDAAVEGLTESEPPAPEE